MNHVGFRVCKLLPQMYNIDIIMPNQTLAYFINFVKKTDRLKPKEADVLALRLKRKKLKSIGRKYKVSYERIRQIENISLKKLNSKSYQEKLF
jgi:DNA-directed RNA polymerase sigma subunit (sigma70/sigma32)